MYTNGWRTVAVSSPVHMSLRDNNLILKKKDQDEEKSVPLSQMRELMILSNQGTISLALLQALKENNVSTVFCDKRKNPSSSLISTYTNTDQAGRIMDQATWTQGRKDLIWSDIIAQKIRMQAQLLLSLDLEIPEQLAESIEAIFPGDYTNREGLASRIYFNQLFGNEFIRHEKDPVNDALNYGYTIILNAMNRILSIHGYHTAIGIHHCSRNNFYNLSCDLMEPFRPFVDRIVYLRNGAELDQGYFKELIEVTQDLCLYNGKRMQIITAMECFAIDVIKSIQDNDTKIGRIDFYRTPRRIDALL